MASDNELLIRIRTILEGQGIKLSAEQTAKLVTELKKASTEAKTLGDQLNKIAASPYVSSLNLSHDTLKKFSVASRDAADATTHFGGKLDFITNFITRRAISAFTGLVVALLGVGTVIRTLANQPEFVTFRKALEDAAGSIGALIIKVPPVTAVLNLLTAAFRGVSDAALALNPSLAPQAVAFGEIHRRAGDAAQATRSLATAEGELARQAGEANTKLERQLGLIQQTESDEIQQLNADENLASAQAAGISDPIERAKKEQEIKLRFNGLRRNARNRSSIAQDELLEREKAKEQARAEEAVAEVPSLEKLQRDEADYNQANALANQAREDKRRLLERRTNLPGELALLKDKARKLPRRRNTGGAPGTRGFDPNAALFKQIADLEAEGAALPGRIGALDRIVGEQGGRAGAIRAASDFDPLATTAADYHREREAIAGRQVTASALRINALSERQDDNRRSRSAFNQSTATDRQTLQVQGGRAIGEAQSQADRQAAEVLNSAIGAISSGGAASVNRIDSLGRAFIGRLDSQDAAIDRLTRAAERRASHAHNNRP